jgi:hypothetical protein
VAASANLLGSILISFLTVRPFASVYSTSLPATNYITVFAYVATAFITGPMPSLIILITETAFAGKFYNVGPNVFKNVTNPFDIVLAAIANSAELNGLNLIGFPSLFHSHGIYVVTAANIASVKTATDFITGPNEFFINLNIQVFL